MRPQREEQALARGDEALAPIALLALASPLLVLAHPLLCCLEAALACRRQATCYSAAVENF